MNGITRAVDDVAREIGATVNWTALHDNLLSPPVATLIAAAATIAFNTSLLHEHQQDINEMLDAAKGAGGSPEAQQIVAAALAIMSLTLLDQRQAAVDRVRGLITPLSELGVLETPA